MPSKTPKQARFMAAYLAGFMDGEGTLTVTRHTRKDRPGYVRFNIRVAVYNTNLGILRTLQECFGGTIMVADRGDIWKPQGQLAWSEEQIVPLLTQLLPFLILKKPQAELLLALQSTKLSASDGRKKGLSAEVIQLREEGYRTLKELNKRGRDHAVEIRKAG